MTYRKFYLITVIGIFLLSVYPLYMGMVTLGNYIKNGSVNSSDYPKYVIPYTPVCIALIVTVVLLPVIFKYLKSFTLLFACFLGSALFFASEIGFERITVTEGNDALPLESWQYSLCVATPQVLKSIGKPAYAADNPAFKFHFYIIAIIIILTVINFIFGFSKMLLEHNKNKLRPLIAQGVSAALLISLCILACFTAFYRNGTVHISPLSAALMSVFFILFGITAGIFLGSLTFRKKTLLSKILPAITASLTVLVMYIGELVLMDGELFQYGKGFLFAPLGRVPFSILDLVILIFTGAATYLLMSFLNSRRSSPPSAPL